MNVQEIPESLNMGKGQKWMNTTKKPHSSLEEWGCILIFFLDFLSQKRISIILWSNKSLLDQSWGNPSQ